LKSLTGEGKGNTPREDKEKGGTGTNKKGRVKREKGVKESERGWKPGSESCPSLHCSMGEGKEGKRNHVAGVVETWVFSSKKRVWDEKPCALWETAERKKFSRNSQRKIARGRLVLGKRER